MTQGALKHRNGKIFFAIYFSFLSARYHYLSSKLSVSSRIFKNTRQRGYAVSCGRMNILEFSFLSLAICRFFFSWELIQTSSEQCPCHLQWQYHFGVPFRACLYAPFGVTPTPGGKDGDKYTNQYHVLDSKSVKILDKERDWQRRGIKEAIWERVENPTLNRKGGGTPVLLSHTWDRALFSVPRRLSHDSELPRDQLHWWRPMVLVETSSFKLSFKISDIDLFIYTNQ